MSAIFLIFPLCLVCAALCMVLHYEPAKDARLSVPLTAITATMAFRSRTTHRNRHGLRHTACVAQTPVSVAPRPAPDARLHTLPPLQTLRWRAALRGNLSGSDLLVLWF